MRFFDNSADIRLLQALMAILKQASWSQNGNLDKCATFSYMGFRSIEDNSNNPPVFFKRCNRTTNVGGGTQEFGAQSFDGRASLSHQPELGEAFS